MLRLALAATVLFFGLSPATAQDLEWSKESEIAKFEQCYAETDINTLVEECKYIPRCINGAVDNSSSLGMLACARTGYELWDKKLNSEYKELLRFVAGYGDESAESLILAQQAWVEFREAECTSRYYRQDYVGSLGGAVSQSCRAQLTATRTSQIRRENLSFRSR